MGVGWATSSFERIIDFLLQVCQPLWWSRTFFYFWWVFSFVVLDLLLELGEPVLNADMNQVEPLSQELG